MNVFYYSLFFFYSILLCHCIIKIHRVHKIILNWLCVYSFSGIYATCKHTHTHTSLVLLLNVVFVIEWLFSFINIIFPHFFPHLTSLLINENYISNVFVDFLFRSFCWYVDDNFVLKMLESKSEKQYSFLWFYFVIKCDWEGNWFSFSTEKISVKREKEK